MNALRGSTFSPMSTVNTSSACTASSSVICLSVRVSGFMVVSQSSCGSISPRPLKRLMSIFAFGLSPRISAEILSRSSSEKATRAVLPRLSLYSGGMAE